MCKKKKKVKKGTDWKQEGFPLETEYLKYEVFNNYKTTATTIKQMKSRKKLLDFCYDLIKLTTLAIYLSIMN